MPSTAVLLVILGRTSRGFQGYSRDGLRVALVSQTTRTIALRWPSSLPVEIGDQSVAEQGRAPVRLGNRIIDSRTITVPVSPMQAFAPIRRIGGAAGRYYGDWLRRLRGLLDMAVGAPVLRRSRRHPEDLRPGDRVDCWRVVAYEPNRRPRLEAEMMLPGRAWREFEVTGDRCRSAIRQTAVFDPKGLLGLLYWHVLRPVHGRLFRGMLNTIGRTAAGQRDVS